MLELANRFDFEGHRIAWGALGEGPPLVLVHGTPFSSQVWRRIAPWLARRHRVFFYDLLGYGQSDMPDADVSLGRQNALFGAMLREWGLVRPRVLAHDYGGATVLRAHFLDGVAYADLTLVNPVAIAPQGSPFVRHVAQHEAAFVGLPAYAHHALVSAYIGNAAARPLSDEALLIYRSPWLTPAASPRSIARSRRCASAISRKWKPAMQRRTFRCASSGARTTDGFRSRRGRRSPIASRTAR
ncbi:alpha/beta fold hydrolase [Burkholderia cenocepacia]